MTAIGVVGPRPAAAVPETSLAAQFFSEILPWVQRDCPKQTFVGGGNVNLAYRICPAASPTGGPVKGTIVFIHGYSEAALKYSELLYDLSHAGYQVFALDLRGMGESARMVANPQMGYVNSFQDYADDIVTFVTTVVRPKALAPVFMLAHSAGGLAAVLALHEHPDLVRGAALTAPMLGLNLKQGPVGLPRWLIAGMASTAVKVGLGDHYLPGSSDYDLEQDDAAKSFVTHSLVRAKISSELYQQQPQLRVWGASFAWLNAALVGTEAAAALAPQVKTPLLLLQAKEDVVVDLAAQSTFCHLAPSCNLIVVEHAKHEILNEVDAVRSPAIAEILTFFH